MREFIDAPVQNYSSGMWVRLGYAIASHLNPDVLLVDEVLAVGDLAFRRQCLRHMQRYLRQGGSLVLVSHNIRMLQSICERGLLIDQGYIACAGSTVEVVNHYIDSQIPQNVNGSSGNVDWVDLDDDHPLVIEKAEIASLCGEEIRTGHDACITISYRSIREIDGVF